MQLEQMMRKLLEEAEDWDLEPKQASLMCGRVLMRKKKRRA